MQFIRDISIGRKLAGLLFINALLFAISAIIGITTSTTMATNSSAMYSGQLTPLTYINDARTAFLEARVNMREAYIANDTATAMQKLRNAQQSIHKSETSMAKFAATLRSDMPIRKKAYNDFLKDIEDFKTIGADVTDALIWEDKGKAHELLMYYCPITSDKILAEFEKIIATQKANAHRADASNARTASNSFLILLSVSGIGLGLLISGGIIISRLISEPVILLSEAAAKVGNGNYNAVVNIAQQDELGRLSLAFNAMTEKIRMAQEESQDQQEYLQRNFARLHNQMQRFAKGDLTVYAEAERDDVVGDLLKGFNASVANLRAMLLKLSEAAATSAGAATQIRKAAAEIATGAKDQSQQTIDAAAAVEEMVHTILSNAQSAGHAAKVAAENRAVAQSGGKIMDQTTHMIREISAVVQDSAKKIEQLGNSSNEIGAIVSVIDDIADQTNLLALNAAIEAARAGEHGRGFAVVADEVRKLAERTTIATKQIAVMIKGIQRETSDVVVSMNKGSSAVSSGIELTDKADDILKHILQSSQEVFNNVTQIAVASEEQSATSEQIARSVSLISDVATQSAVGIEQIARSANELSYMTDNINDLIAQFKILEFDANHRSLHQTGISLHHLPHLRLMNVERHKVLQ
ncbi:MAG TPA: methyl-accepting chemotaxis protein [Patescibacteria group bacterium]|nr:methyl-accepting chemotaxis protein [Patescibacteria group bacterium]